MKRAPLLSLYGRLSFFHVREPNAIYGTYFLNDSAI